jgi:tetratricopeptide (TPR) repeat protein
LLIGSQCDALGKLSFLPSAAVDLYSVLTNAELGGCVPALPEGGLMHDPTVAEAKTAIREAFRAASDNNDLLFLVLIGHGEQTELGKDFFFLPRDASAMPTSDTAINLTQFIKEHWQLYSNVDGLIVFLDACYSGTGALDTGQKWTKDLEGHLRFQVLTAAADRSAYDGCFSRTVAAVVRSGNPQIRSELLYSNAIQKRLKTDCPLQEPQFVANARGEGDLNLWITKNAAQADRAPWLESAAAIDIQSMTVWFQPIRELDAVVAASREERCVAVVGPAGAGKTALSASLARPDITEGRVPKDFVQAVAFISEPTGSAVLARQLAHQLETTVGQAFVAAREEFQRHTVFEERQQLDPVEREVIAPLRWCATAQPVRIVIDGLDRLSEANGAARTIPPMLNVLAADQRLSMCRLVVTSRPDTPLPAGAHQIVIGPADADEIRRYLVQREIPEHHHEAVIGRAQGNWLIARLVADVLSADPEKDPATIAGSRLVGEYDAVLQGLGAAGPQRWRRELRPVLSVLAAAGTRPILPFKLLCAASGRLGGPDGPTGVHDILTDLRGYVLRSSPGTDAEHVGIFHHTFADYLLDPAAGQFGIAPSEPHRALVDAIAELAPMDQHDPADQIHRYAFYREAEHLMAIGQLSDATASLKKRESLIPAENLRRWRSFYDAWVQWKTRGQRYRVLRRLNVPECSASAAIFSPKGPWRLSFLEALHPGFTKARFRRLLWRKVLGGDALHTLIARGNIAYWTGQAGNVEEALRLFKELLPDQQRLLGNDHPDTLGTRSNIGGWTGETGNVEEALRLFEELLPDQQRVLGNDHPDTLATRNNIAVWTGETGDAEEALRLFKELLADQQRVLGNDHPNTLRTRNNIAYWTGRIGNAEEALRLFEELLADQQRVLGNDHPDALTTRSNIASWTGETGNAAEALRLFKEFLADQQRVLGNDHPDTLRTRNNIASCTGQTGNAEEALRLFKELLADRERVLGKDHPDTLITRNNIVSWTGETGNVEEALRLFKELLADQQRALGNDHPDTLRTHSNIASWTAQTGNAEEALRLFKELLADQQRVLGNDHPDTLRTRHNIAHCMGETGNAEEALCLFKELLARRERVLGDDHPDTLITRSNIAFWTGQTGNAEGALRLIKELLADQRRVLGSDHPDTLTTRNNIAFCTGQTGHTEEALRLFKELLTDQQRVLGNEHPDTLRTCSHIAYWTKKGGDSTDA